MPRTRRVPQRLCLGCQEMRGKKEMVRIVRTPGGSVEVDPTGKKAGRGAYICPDPGCLEQAVRGKRLEKALSVPVDPSLLETLRRQLNGAGRGTP